MSNTSEIMISVICITYNHEKYIRRSLDGLVSQKCNVPYEIIVHDDASSDATPSIIKEYADAYPDLIHPVLQSENQLSQGKDDIAKPAYEKCRGKYIALCEGDDYWDSQFKLQKQFDAMEAHSECCFCTNLVTCCNEDGTPHEETFPPKHLGLNASGIISQSQMAGLLWGSDGYPFHTCSYFFKRETLETSFSLFSKLPGVTGDQLYMRSTLLNGPIWYIHEGLSVRRLFPIGGWSERQQAGGRKKDFELALTMHNADIIFDKLSSYKYHKRIYAHIFENLIAFAPFYPNDVKRYLRNYEIFFLNSGIYAKSMRRKFILLVKYILLLCLPKLLSRIYSKDQTQNV